MKTLDMERKEKGRFLKEGGAPTWPQRDLDETDLSERLNAKETS